MRCLKNQEKRSDLLCRILRILQVLLVVVFSGCGRPRVERIEWPVMGTIAAVQWKSGADHAPVRSRRLAQVAFAEVESLMNAHNPSAEISRLALLSDEKVVLQCDQKMRPCYEAAFRLQRETGGAFNPRWKGGRTLDMGAIAKGFAVDLAYKAIRQSSEGARTLLDLGGNLRSVGDEWDVGILGTDGRKICRRALLRPTEALATSATYYRGQHILDGRTNQVVSNGVSSVTVMASSAMLADGLSTSLFVLGQKDGLRLVKEHYADDVRMVLWVMEDGRQIDYDPDCRLSQPASS